MSKQETHATWDRKHTTVYKQDKKTRYLLYVVLIYSDSLTPPHFNEALLQSQASERAVI